MRVSVARIAVMDSTGQCVELLQGDGISQPQVGGDQVPASHAVEITAFHK